MEPFVVERLVLVVLVPVALVHVMFANEDGVEPVMATFVKVAFVAMRFVLTEFAAKKFVVVTLVAVTEANPAFHRRDAVPKVRVAS